MDEIMRNEISKYLNIDINRFYGTNNTAIQIYDKLIIALNELKKIVPLFDNKCINVRFFRKIRENENITNDFNVSPNTFNNKICLNPTRKNKEIIVIKNDIKFFIDYINLDLLPIDLYFTNGKRLDANKTIKCIDYYINLYDSFKNRAIKDNENFENECKLMINAAKEVAKIREKITIPDIAMARL